MEKTFFQRCCLTIFACLCWMSVNAQQTVTVRLRKATLVQLFKAIEQQTSYVFSYQSGIVGNGKTISIERSNAQVSSVLDEALRGSGLTYDIVSSHSIVISKQKAKSSATSQHRGAVQGAVQGSVWGVVTDSNGDPVIGASVKSQGGRIGAVTDNAGRFELAVPEGTVLEISYIGFMTKTVRATGRSLKVTLSEDTKLMDEVVVVGYGTQKKVNLTGAVDQIDNEVLKNRPSANLSQMLEGAVANLNIQLADGKPGRGSTFNVRGVGSINGGSALVLIDGAPGNANMLNPDDVESVSVLKDAASAAIYGSRAPYGVVLITTKGAKKGKPEVNYSSEYTFQTPQNVPDLVTDGYEWAQHFYDARYGYYHKNPTSMNTSQKFSMAWLEEYKRRHDEGDFGTVISDGSIFAKNSYVYYPEGTDWYDLLYKDHTFTTTQNVSVSGADGMFSYYVSGRYFNYGGLFNSATQTDKYTKYNFRAKAGYQATKWLKLSNNMSYGFSKYYNPINYSDNGGTVWRSINDEGHPTAPLRNPDGTFTSVAIIGGVADLLYGKSGIDTHTKVLKNTTSADLSFLKNTLRFHGDFTFYNSRNDSYKKLVKTPYSQAVDSFGESILSYTSYGTMTNLAKTWSKTDTYVSNIWGEYENTFAQDHNFKAMAGWNYEKSSAETLYGYNSDLLTDDVTSLSLAMSSTNRNIYNTYSAYQYAGLFHRINYNWKNRYLVEYDGRLDGSSKFSSNKRWHYFPSGSIGWRVTEEPWFKVNPSAFSNLKLRFSIGSLGNANGLGNYQYKQIMSVAKSGYVLNGTRQNYVSRPAAVPESLTWEKATTYDWGMDVAFLKDRLSATFDYYLRKTTGMITSGPTVPDVFGVASPRGNYADLSTRGWELTLQWKDRFNMAGRPFNYSVRATLADHYSVIDKYNNATMSLTTTNGGGYYKGKRIGEIWGFVIDGLYQSQAEIDEDMAKANAAGQKRYNTLMQNSKDWKMYPGDVRVKDLDGNGYISRGKNTVDDPGDRKVIGNTEARYIYSFGFNADWNGIYLSAFFQGVGKQDWYPSSESPFWGQYNREYNQMPKWMEGNYWTEDNTSAYLPRYASRYKVFYQGNQYANTRYLQNVAYLRLKNIQIGYDLPKRWISHVGLQRVNIHVSGENLFTWSPLYKHSKDFNVSNIYGSDSDLISSNMGDGNNYPMMKSFSFGLNITL